MWRGGGGRVVGGLGGGLGIRLDGIAVSIGV